MENEMKLDVVQYEDKKKELLFCICLGWCGGHKFYRKNFVIGFLYFITVGYFCIGWIADIIKLTKELENMKRTNDKKDTLLKNQDVDVEQIVLNNGKNRVNAIKEYREMTGADLKTAMQIVDATYSSLGINLFKKSCPKCGSDNYHAFVEDKVKRSSSINLNPLKPFTVLNHKEKVVRQVSKFVCDDCGKIFQ